MHRLLRFQATLNSTPAVEVLSALRARTNSLPWNGFASRTCHLSDTNLNIPNSSYIFEITVDDSSEANASRDEIDFNIIDFGELVEEVPPS
jgi:hypothetical protein